ncbi:MAG: hypothetical protein KF745_12990 [Phycisphaeraceae bacterium]|nr:hypothetical protein [Phycisphaeraceae bacterium]
MFLPVLLIRDFGPLGFVVFAVPNVVGAAAMAWVLSRQGASESLVARHRTSMRWFSIATIAFQFFVTGVVVATTDAVFGWGLGAAAVFAIAVLAGWALRPPCVGVAALCISAVLAGVYLLRGGPGGLFAGDLPAPELPRSHLLGLAAACGFGFLLCPYLDLTFHRARQSLTAPAAKAAFAIGFGVLFLGAILLTAAYAGMWLGQSWSRAALAVVLAHLLVQTGATTGFHTRETAAAGKVGGVGEMAALAAVLAAGAGWISTCPISIAPGAADLNARFELVYRLFMSFYGLVFPAYVWICMAGSSAATKPLRRRLAWWVTGVAIAAPAFWIGFVERGTMWTLVGVAVAILAGIFGNLREKAQIGGHQFRCNRVKMGCEE